jgi:hypothetical protein
MLATGSDQHAVRAFGLMVFGYACVAALAPMQHALAQATDTAGSSSSESGAVAAQQGAFLMETMAPATDRTSPGVAFTTAGYDGAHDEPVFGATGDMHVYGPLDLRVGLTYAPEAPQGQSKMQPNVGARVNLLAQSRSGIDLSTALFYRMERYTGDDGVVQGMLALGRHFGRLGLFANLAYAQDPEGDDRDGDVALAMLYALEARLQLGVEAKCRFDLFSTDEKRALRDDPAFESASGPVRQYAIGPLALLVKTGVSTLTTNHTRVGAMAIGGFGAAY